MLYLYVSAHMYNSYVISLNIYFKRCHSFEICFSQVKNVIIEIYGTIKFLSYELDCSLFRKFLNA